jgi:hypothetical protein
MLLIAVLTGCGGVAGDSNELLNRRMPTHGFCEHYYDLLGVITREKALPDRAMARLAPGFEADERQLRAIRDVELADRAQVIASSMRALLDKQRPASPTADELAQRLVGAVLEMPRGACLGEDSFGWQVGVRDWMELRVPSSWRTFAENWRLPGRGTVGSSIRAGESMVRAQEAFGWEPYRWLFPTAFLGVSRSLAVEMEVNEGRTAVALDRVRAWMERTKLPAGCREVGTAPYEKGVMSGFMRRAEGCGGLGGVLIEIFAVAQHREPDAAVVLLRLTGRRTADVAAFRAAVESFHVIH